AVDLHLASEPVGGEGEQAAVQCHRVLYRRLDPGPHHAGQLGILDDQRGHHLQRRRVPGPGQHRRRGQHLHLRRDPPNPRLPYTAPLRSLQSLSISPQTPSVAKGSKQQFSATGSYTDGSTQDLTTQVTWASSMTNVATISNAAGSQGLATTLAVGTTTISA